MKKILLFFVISVVFSCHNLYANLHKNEMSLNTMYAQGFLENSDSIEMSILSKVNSFDEHGNTALRLAVGDCDEKNVAKLLRLGADKDIQTSLCIQEARSPHQYAQWMKRECEKRLLYAQQHEQGPRTLVSIQRRLTSTKAIIRLFSAQDDIRLMQAVSDCDKAKVVALLTQGACKDAQIPWISSQKITAHAYAQLQKEECQKYLDNEINNRQDFWNLLSIQNKLIHLEAILALFVMQDKAK